MSHAALQLLLVEDDEEDALLTRRVLEQGTLANCAVTWVRSSSAALEAMRRPFDVCLVDYHLGPDTGLALIESAIGNGYCGPMILLTGRGDHDIDVKAMKAGAADYLANDEITPRLLERVIRHAIERKAAHQALRRSDDQLRQAQKMDAIGSLAGGVAHDFNNLLSVILSYSHLAADELPVGDPLRADLEEIKSAGLRAASLTRQLLSFSRQQVLQPVVLDLNGVFSGMEKMLRRTIGEDIELVSLAPILRTIVADAGQIEQVIMNLAINARDAMPRGGKLTIETAEVFLDAAYAEKHVGVQPGPHIMLSVTDSGTGMDATTLARVFEPFFTTKPTGRGTGLGLATVFGIVQQSGGTIWVYSKPDKGTTFKIYFPVSDRAVAASVSRPPPEPRTARGFETVLLVEDDERVRTLACTILRKYGYNVLDAQSGGDALLLCEQQAGPIHLLLTDVVMPRMSGPQLAERLRVIRPDMRVLYMSGYTNDAVMRHGILESTIAFIQKPIMPEALARKVRETLGAPGRIADAPSTVASANG